MHDFSRTPCIYQSSIY